MSDGRGPWIKAQIPHNHQEGSNKRNGKSRERAGLATDISNEDVRERPGEVTGGEVGRPNKHRQQKELGAERTGVVIVAERKTGENACVFQDIADNQADDDERHDAAPAIANRSMNERFAIAGAAS